MRLSQGADIWRDDCSVVVRAATAETTATAFVELLLDPLTTGPSLGFNTSTIHVDIISTSDRTVTATLKDGSTKVIHTDGQFQND